MITLVVYTRGRRNGHSIARSRVRLLMSTEEECYLLLPLSLFLRLLRLDMRENGGNTRVRRCATGVTRGQSSEPLVIIVIEQALLVAPIRGA